MDKKKEIVKTKERVLLKLEKSGGHISNACRLAGISKMTLSNYRRDDPEFDQAVAAKVLEEREKFGEDLVQAFKNKTLGEKVEREDGTVEYMGGDTVAMIWVSKAMLGWQEKKSLEVTSGSKTLLFLPAEDVIEDVEHEEVKRLETDD
jgi:hypothetical protein